MIIINGQTVTGGNGLIGCNIIIIITITGQTVTGGNGLCGVIWFGLTVVAG